MTKRKKTKTPESRKEGRAVDARRGSPLWAYNHYRMLILTRLLDDLVDLEQTGLEDRPCQLISSSLEYFVNVSTEVSGGGFLTGNLYRHTKKFSELYKDWNDIKGRDEKAAYERRLLLEKLRNQRQKITDTAASLQYEIEHSLDRKILEDTYGAIGGLITLVPDLFKGLAAAFGDYIKRGGRTA